MDIRERNVASLERILRELLNIHALAPAAQCGVRRWIDLAISETRSQIEKARSDTLH